MANQPPGRKSSDLPVTERNLPDPGLTPSEERVTAKAPPLPGLRGPGPSPRLPSPAGEAAGSLYPSVPGYEILDVLGRGGMGVVYKAQQKSLNRLVALKMVHAGAHARPDDQARFQMEAEAVARLQHGFIVQIHEVGTHDGMQYFSLELVEGPSLRQLLAGNPQPTRPAARLVELVARAVHFAHQHGIVHRDLKPDNVLLAPPPSMDPQTDRDTARVAALYGVPKVADFGLAKLLDHTSGPTRTGEIMGTPNYMAPEQAAGSKDVGPAADVYALGAILYECLTGRPPFTGTNPMDTVWQVLNEEPVPPGRLRSKIPRDLERICLKCLDKDPKKRYASALDLADDLRRHLKGEPVRARPVGMPGRLWRWSRRNPVAASLLLAISLGSAFGLWYLSELSQSLVESAALDSAAQQATTLEELNKYYARVVGHLKPARIKGSHDWRKDSRTVPLPATLTIELGKQISDQRDSGVEVRLYSDHPFRSRKKVRPQDDFEKEALAWLRRYPDRPFYRFEEYQGRRALRYATARRMQKDCVTCHNSHPDSTEKRDWKEGDVRGVLEIIRPLDRDEDRIREGLEGTLFLVGGVGAALLVVSGLILYLGNRRRTLPVGGLLQ